MLELEAIQDPIKKLELFRPDWEAFTQLTLINAIATHKYAGGEAEMRKIVKSKQFKEVAKSLSQSYDKLSESNKISYI